MHGFEVVEVGDRGGGVGVGLAGDALARGGAHGVHLGLLLRGSRESRILSAFHRGLMAVLMTVASVTGSGLDAIAAGVSLGALTTGAFTPRHFPPSMVRSARESMPADSGVENAGTRCDADEPGGPRAG